MLDVRRLKVLREVATRGSFSAAAEALNFTQSAVSQQIAALERESATTLVERGARGIRLTASGQALVRHADAILARLDDAEQELAAIAGLRGGRLRLASFQSAGATLVPRAVGTFHSRHADVELGVLQAEPGDARDAMAAGEIDVAIVYDFEALPGFLPDDLELTHLLDDPYDVIVPADHPLAKRARISLDDLTNEPWIMSSPAHGCHHYVRLACREAGIAPRSVIEADENDATQAFVAGGLGVSLLPRLALATLNPGVVVKRLGTEAPARRIWAARLAGSYQSAASDAMIALLVEVAREYNELPLAHAGRA